MVILCSSHHCAGLIASFLKQNNGKTGFSYINKKHQAAAFTHNSQTHFKDGFGALPEINANLKPSTAPVPYAKAQPKAKPTTKFETQRKTQPQKVLNCPNDTRNASPIDSTTSQSTTADSLFDQPFYSTFQGQIKFNHDERVGVQSMVMR